MIPIKKHDDYLNPPELPEAVFCDACGEEMEVRIVGYPFVEFSLCTNKFCPDKHIGIAEEMARYILELKDTILFLEGKLGREEGHR